MKNRHSQKIMDEFANLPISPQRKYQLRKRRDHRCVICGEPIGNGSRCLKHMVQNREGTRLKLGIFRRYDSLSYRMERAENKPAI